MTNASRASVFALPGCRSAIRHRQAGQVGHLHATGPSHRDRQRADSGGLVNHYQDPAVSAELGEQRPQTLLIIGERSVVKALAGLVQRDRVMVALAHIQAAVDVEIGHCRTLPHALRRVDVGDDTLAELEVLIGYDDHLAQESTRLINRIRGLLTHIHPALERAIGPKLDGKAALELLSRHGGPAGLRKAGRRKLTATAIKIAPRAGAGLVEAIMAALDEQTVVVPGTAAAETVLPRLADGLRDVLTRRTEVAAQVEEILDAHPLAEVLISMPGIGIRTAARILLEVGDGTHFRTPGHLAAYAGIAPVTHRSGSSIRGGNKQLKRAFFLSAFAAPQGFPPPGPTTTANGLKARNTTPP
jgi:hypothetical protein